MSAIRLGTTVTILAIMRDTDSIHDIIKPAIGHDIYRTKQPPISAIGTP